MRRIRTRPLGDPLGQGLLTLFAAVGAALLGCWLLFVHQASFAGPLLLVAAMLAVVYATLATRAFKRDKAVQFWNERQRFELALNRAEAHRAVLATELRHLHDIEFWQPSDGLPSIDPVKKLVDRLYMALAARHDDVAVVLARQYNQRCLILHSKVSAAGRWRELATGKECILKGTFEDKLEDLSVYNRAFELQAASDYMRLAVLYDSPLSKAETALLKGVRDYCKMVSRGWEAAAWDRVVPIRSVS